MGHGQSIGHETFNFGFHLEGHPISNFYAVARIPSIRNNRYFNFFISCHFTDVKFGKTMLSKLQFLGLYCSDASLQYSNNQETRNCSTETVFFPVFFFISVFGIKIPFLSGIRLFKNKFLIVTYWILANGLEVGNGLAFQMKSKIKGFLTNGLHAVHYL
jgi:hypothetical protein